MNLVLSLLVENNPGIVNRITRQFTHRGYDIDSLNVGKTNDPLISQMTIVTHGDNNTFQQIERHLDKLVEVIEVSPLEEGNAIFRELALIKVEVYPEKHDFLYDIARDFNGKILAITSNTFVFEIIEDEKKISELLYILKDFNVLEVVRTGLTGIKL
jgi:acetolactate synthase-1/3 small subunit